MTDAPVVPDDLDEPHSWGRWMVSGGVQILAVLGLLALLGRARAPELPTEAPALALSTLDGEAIDLASLRGRPVLLNFWASWCLPCKIELPALKTWAALHPEVTVLGVSIDRDPNALRRALPGLNLPWPTVLDDGSAARDWGVTTVPTSILISPGGQIQGAHTGIALGPELEAMLRGL